MSEYARSGNKGQEPIPELELSLIVESMSFEHRLQYKQKLLSEIDDREKMVWLINDVNQAEGKGTE